MRIGNIEVEKGKRTDGYFEIGYTADGQQIKIPVIIVAGAEDGEVYWAEGGIHGTEISGAMAIIEAAQEIDPAKLKGIFVGVPVINLMAHRAGHHHSPADYSNLNHVFPGDADGSYTSQLAAAYFEIVSSCANYVLDFHNGGHDMIMPYYCGYIVQDGTPLAKKTKKLVQYSGAHSGWVTHFSEFHSKLPSQLASLTKAGIATMIVESGSADCERETIENYKKSIFGGMRGFGFLDGEPYNNPNMMITMNGKTPTGPKTHRGGLFVALTTAGAVLKKGAPVGKVIDLFGNVLEEYFCPEEDMYVNSILKTGTPITNGAMYGEFSVVTDEK